MFNCFQKLFKSKVKNVKYVIINKLQNIFLIKKQLLKHFFWLLLLLKISIFTVRLPHRQTFYNFNISNLRKKKQIVLIKLIY